jgi:hypothetical protein
MPEQAVRRINDAIGRTKALMSKDKFTKEELEAIKELFEKALEATGEAIERCSD